MSDFSELTVALWIGSVASEYKHVIKACSKTPLIPMLTLDFDDLLRSGSSRFNTNERATSAHCLGDWVVTRDGLNVVARKKILILAGIEPM
jgi:hypothetical protein